MKARICQTSSGDRRRLKAGIWVPLAALDHRLQKALVAQLRREEVRPSRAGAMAADIALAGIGDPAGGDGVRLAEERVRGFVIVREAAAHRKQRDRRRQRETEKRAANRRRAFF
jgi:hypothetical protein